MQKIKYFFQFVLIIFLFLIFKLLGLKYSSYISGKLVNLFGPFFRPIKLITSNILKFSDIIGKLSFCIISKILLFNKKPILPDG